MQLVPTWKRDYEICNTWFTGWLLNDDTFDCIEENVSPSWLHKSLKDYLLCMCVMFTEDYMIRIDKITADGQFRFSLWKSGHCLNDMRQAPDFILFSRDYDVSKDVFVFKDKECFYRITRESLKNPGKFEIIENEDIIISQIAKK